ncbi:MAG TPA: hypothetical protein VKU94_00930 [Geobacterales bacterium]|nr:hypothetical protein [Geobacterales bacterium]
MRGQALILTSFVISLIIIALAFTNLRLQVYVIDDEEETKTSTIFSFYTSALSYATNKTFHDLLNGNIDCALASQKATNDAKTYWNQATSNLKVIFKNSSFGTMPNLDFEITSNCLKGKGASFRAKVQENNTILANITSYVFDASLRASNTSIGVYYYITIFISSVYIISEDLKIKDSSYNITAYSQGSVVDFVAQRSGDFFTLIFDGTYKDKLLIEIKNQENIVLWLFA